MKLGYKDTVYNNKPAYNDIRVGPSGTPIHLMYSGSS